MLRCPFTAKFITIDPLRKISHMAEHWRTLNSTNSTHRLCANSKKVNLWKRATVADKVLFSPPTYSTRYVLFLLGVYRYESGCNSPLCHLAGIRCFAYCGAIAVARGYRKAPCLSFFATFLSAADTFLDRYRWWLALSAGGTCFGVYSTDEPISAGDFLSCI